MKQENFPLLASFSILFLDYWEPFAPKISITSDET